MTKNKNNNSGAASANRRGKNTKNLTYHEQQARQGQLRPYSAKVYDEDAEKYMAQLLDPWAQLGAKIPDIHSYPTTSFSITTPFKITSDANGRACMIVRDGLYRHYTANTVLPNQSAAGLTYSVVGGQVGWHLSVLDLDDIWAPVAESSSILGAFSAYRPVAMGMKIEYIDAPLNATGRIAAGLWPGTESLPSDNIGSPGLDVDTFGQFTGVEIHKALGGCTTVWRPFSANGICEFRQTKAYLLAAEEAELDAKRGKKPDKPPKYSKRAPVRSGAEPNAGPVWWQECWDTDASAYPAAYASCYAFNDEATHAVTPYMGVQSSLNNVIAQQSPAMVMVMDGLVASKVVFSGEITYVVEAIPDNRGFSLVQPNTHVRTSTGHLHPISKMQLVPHSHAGGTSKSHHSFIERLGEGFKTAEKVIGEIAKVAGPFISAIGTVAALL